MEIAEGDNMPNEFGRRDYDNFILEELNCLKSNQGKIRETLNNGLKHKTEETVKRLELLENRFNKLLLAMGAGMFTVIIMLVQILMRLE